MRKFYFYWILTALGLLSGLGIGNAKELYGSISEEQTIELAKNWAECEPPKVECQVTSDRKDGNFEVTISYVAFESDILREWARRVGTRRFAFSPTGQVSIAGGQMRDVSTVRATFDEIKLAQRDQSWVKDLITKNRSRFVCGNIGFVDGGSAFDGPAWYINETTQELISTCGGVCMLPFARDQYVMCKTMCPPPSWLENSCREKMRADYLSRLPAISQQRAIEIASRQAGCDAPRIVCELQSSRTNDNFVIEITYKKFEDQSAKDWADRFGLKRGMSEFLCSRR